MKPQIELQEDLSNTRMHEITVHEETSGFGGEEQK